MTATKVRAAATACIIRDGPDGLEVLLARRSMESSFVPGAFVFPGGKVDDADHLAADPFKAAVVRETFEEVGILLVDALATPVDRQVPLARQRSHADLAYEQLLYLSTWVTPEWMGHRFDTRFFLAVAPAGAVASIDGHELTSAAWFRPRDAVEQSASGDLFIISPTVAHLRYLGHYESAEEALAGATSGHHSTEIDQELQEGRRPQGL